MNNRKSLELEKWAIRFCALAFVSGIYLTVSADEKDKNEVKRAVASSACAVLSGIGMGMASYKVFNCERE